MGKADIHYEICIYGPESDYTYEKVDGVEFKSIKDAKSWIGRNIPKHLGYKIVKVQAVVKQPPRKPHYVQ